MMYRATGMNFLQPLYYSKQGKFIPVAYYSKRLSLCIGRFDFALPVVTYICRLSKYPPKIALPIIGSITISMGENPVASETKPTKSCT